MQAVQFITQPLSSLYGLSRYEQNQEECKQTNQNIISFALLNGQLLPLDVSDKIYNFIHSELKLDTSNLFFFIKPPVPGQEGIPQAGSGGSTRINGRCLYFSPELVEEMKQEFKPSHKFLIAHEMGHLETDDPYKGKYERDRAMQWAGLGGYTFVALASPFIPMGLIGTHLLGCAVGKCAELYICSQKMHEQELRADQFAAKISPEIAAGGIDLFKQIQQHQLKTKQEPLSNSAGFFEICQKISSYIFVDSNGNSRINYSHPSEQTRINRLLA